MCRRAERKVESENQRDRWSDLDYGLSRFVFQSLESPCSSFVLDFHETPLILYKNSSLLELSLGSFCFLQPKDFLIRCMETCIIKAQSMN